MKRKKLSIKFYLNTYKPHKDGYKIYLRVIYDQKKFEVATDYYSIQDEWDKQAGRSKGSMSGNPGVSNEHGKKT
jgi:Arm DNA-binding domain